MSEASEAYNIWASQSVAGIIGTAQPNFFRYTCRRMQRQWCRLICFCPESANNKGGPEFDALLSFFRFFPGLRQWVGSMLVSFVGRAVEVEKILRRECNLRLYNGSRSKCVRCGHIHSGPCRIRCCKCTFPSRDEEIYIKVGGNLMIFFFDMYWHLQIWSMYIDTCQYRDYIDSESPPSKDIQRKIIREVISHMLT